MVALQTTVALGAIGTYLAVVLALGYRGWQVGTVDAEDWMTAGRSLGVVVLLFTYTASYHSAFAFLGVGGYVYANGIGAFGPVFLWVTLSGVIFWVVGTHVWLLAKRYGYVTPADLLEDAYGSPLLGKLVSLVLIVVTFPYVAIQMIGSGLIFETATDGLVSFELGAALLLVVGVAYVWLGGLRAVAWTDTVQGVFMFGAMWIGGLFFVFSAYSGPAAFWSELTANFAAYVTLPGPAGVFTPAYYTSLWIVFGIGGVMLPHFFLRFVSARSPRVLKWSASAGTGYLILFYVPTVFLALGAVSAFPDLGTPDSAIPEVLYATTPVWFASLVLAGGIAAAMSTADSQLHAVATLLTRDWYGPLTDREVDGKTVGRAARLLVPVLGGISYVIAIQRFEFILNLASVSLSNAAQVFPILLGALFWDSATRRGALTGFVLGVSITSALTFDLVALPAALPGFVPGLYGLLVTTLVFVGASLAGGTDSPDLDRIQSYLEYASERQWRERQ